MRLVPIALAPNDDSLLEGLEPELSDEQRTYRVEASFWLTEARFDVEGPEASQIEVRAGGENADSGFSLAVGDNAVEVSVETSEGQATYEIVVHRRMPVRLSPASEQHRFGQAVAVAGNLLVVGAPATGAEPGLVRTFQRTSPGIWDEVTGELSGDGSFGTSLAFDGTTLLVGAPSATSGDSDRAGRLHFYRRTDTGWQPEQAAPTSTPSFAREIGYNVALSDGSAASCSDNVNELHTYSRDSGAVWREDSGGFLEAEDGLSFIEGTVTIDGNWLVVGAHNGSGPAAFLFTRGGPGASWTTPSNGDSMLQASGMFADAVTLNDRTLVVNGQPVRVFERADDNTWTNVPLAVDSLGPLAPTEHALVVGSQEDASNQTTGDEVHVFRRADENSNWQEDPSSPLPTTVGAAEAFGVAVATDGCTVVVGAPKDGLAGAVYVYD